MSKELLSTETLAYAMENSPAIILLNVLLDRHEFGEDTAERFIMVMTQDAACLERCNLPPSIEAMLLERVRRDTARRDEFFAKLQEQEDPTSEKRRGNAP